MGQLIDEDVEHLRLLKIGYFVNAGLTAFISMFGLMYVSIGGAVASAVAKEAGRGRGDVDPKLIGMLFAFVGLVIVVFGFGSAVLNFLAAKGLEQRRRRTLCYVAAVFSCLSIPWGTILGVFTFIVLNRPTVRAMFDNPGAMIPQPPPHGPPAWHS